MIAKIQTTATLPFNRIRGVEIKNTAGEPVGKIEDLMIDWSRSEVAYAVISCGNFAEMTDILFAVPLEAFQFKKENESRQAILNVNQNNLRDAPGFSKEYWPKADNHNFTRMVYSHYGINYE